MKLMKLCIYICRHTDIWSFRFCLHQIRVIDTLLNAESYDDMQHDIMNERLQGSFINTQSFMY